MFARRARAYRRRLWKTIEHGVQLKDEASKTSSDLASWLWQVKTL
jgi:hypothetical protein